MGAELSVFTLGLFVLHIKELKPVLTIVDVTVQITAVLLKLVSTVQVSSRAEDDIFSF